MPGDEVLPVRRSTEYKTAVGSYSALAHPICRVVVVVGEFWSCGEVLRVRRNTESNTATCCACSSSAVINHLLEPRKGTIKELQKDPSREPNTPDLSASNTSSAFNTL